MLKINDDALPDDLKNYFDMSLEAIDYQVGSKFGTLISQQMKRLIDYGEQWDKTYDIGKKGVSTVKIGKEKYNDMKRFLSKDVGPVIAKIVKAEAGINITSVKLNPPNMDNTILAMSANFHNVAMVEDRALGASEGANSLALNIHSSDKVRAMREVSDSISHDKGKIMTDIKNNKISFTLSYGLLCLKDVLPLEKANKLQMTADELAAAFLHEIGHVFVWYELSSELGAIGMYGNSVIRQAMNQVREDPVSSIKDMEEMYKAVEKSNIPISIKKKNKKAFDMVNRIIQLELPMYITTVVVTGYISWLVMLSSMVGTLGQTLTSYRQFSYPDAEMSRQAYEQGTKNTRGTTTFREKTSHERLADEFVSRLGFGKDLSSSLMKLDGVYKHLAGSGIYTPRLNSIIRNSRVLRITSTIGLAPLLFIQTFVDEMRDGKTSHEGTIARMQRNIANLNDVLNRYDLPRDTRIAIVNDIEAMTKQVQKFRSGRMFSPLFVFSKVMMFLPKFSSSALDIWTNGQLNKEYAVVFNEIDKILSNKAGYYRTKLEEFT